MSSRVRCIVLDFDGTFTLVDQEAEPFVLAFREAFARELGTELAGRWDEMGARIDADPGHYGWEHRGRIVAPAHADPYVRSTTIAQLLLAEAGLGVEERRDRIEVLFRESYPASRIVFRPDAADTIAALVELRIPVFVVTNSATDHVREKIGALGVAAARDLPVHGDARKFAVEPSRRDDPRFAALPESETIEGLPRPVWLRRGAYFDVLAELWDATGAGPETTLVCGDIYELDLAMPARLGARVHQVARPQTPEHEREAARRAGGTVSDTLGSLLDVLGA